MDIELSLLADKYIDKEDIEPILYNLGFKKHETYDSYTWFNNDYVSTKGCMCSFHYDFEVLISDGPEINKVFQTVLLTKTDAGRSYGDLEIQLEVLRKIQEKFGGEVFDLIHLSYGIIDNDLPKLSRTEIACGLAYSHFSNNLNKAGMLIEEVDIEKYKIYKEMGIVIPSKELLRNNTLLPFFVSVLETFLKSFFVGYLETNEEAMNKIFNKREKLPYSTVRELLSGKKTIIDLEVEEYSFQNFKSANRGYKQYLNLDLYDLLSKKIKYNENEEIISSILQEMIDLRHEIIHEARLENDLDKTKMDKYFYFLKRFGEIFIEDSMKKYKIRLRIDDEL